MTAAEKHLLVERFLVKREVGRGAAGIVYAAFDQKRGSDVALKVMQPTSGEPPERFLAEGDVLSSLDHPGIVGVFDYGSLERPFADDRGHRFPAGSAYLAMEWLEGEDLSARQKRAPLTLLEAIDVTRQVAAALAVAHDGGVVHRDIKPSNIFLCGGQASGQTKSGFGTLRGGEIDDGLPANKPVSLSAKILDFGVALGSDPSMSEAGAIVGTPAYMSPEQAQGEGSPDARSDLYSLGATLFELCASQPPHAASTSIATLARRVTGPAPRLSELVLDVPERLDDLVARMLESSPHDRPASAHEVQKILAELCNDATVARAGRLTLRADDNRARLGTRLVTTLVALGVGAGEKREAALARLREIGADALTLGADSIVAHLGARRAHGDEANRALEIGQELARAGARVGVATGRTRVDLTQSSGDIVDRAAKLAREAKEGTAACDLTTSELSRGRFEFDVPSLGESAIVSNRRRKPESESSTFVGREAELLLLLDAYERCEGDQAPIVASVSGPPGIGKSRLGQEAITRLERRPRPPRVMMVRSESYGSAQALGAASDLLRSLLLLPRGVSRDAALAAIKASVSPGRQDAEEFSWLAHLLSNEPFPETIDPRAARDALYVSMTELVIEACGKHSCALVMEDAQWADPESVAWVDHLLGRAQGLPLFALVVVRPAFWRKHPERLATRDHVRVELRPMARRAVREIARSLIGGNATDAQLDSVTEQAAGSPLFAEELARLVQQGKGIQGAATIEAAIQVSLDGLDDAARDAVGRLSVFGLSVWEAGLSALWPEGAPQSKAVLTRLVRADLLVETGKARFSNTREFLFKHALVRDVAYAMVGDDQKRELHGSAAAWLATVSEDASTIAEHYDRGQRFEEAAGFWEVAARRALATNSLADAVTMSERALAFADDKPTGFARAALFEEAQARLDARGSERDTAIMSMRENTYDEASRLRTEGAAARYDDARAQGVDIEGRLRDVRDRAREHGLLDEAARCSATLAQRLAFAGELPAAEREAASLLEHAERDGIGWTAVDAWQTLAIVHQTRGELAEALEARRSAARAARTAGLQEREAILTMNLGFALTTIGAKNEALLELESGLAKGQSIGSFGAVRHGQMNLLGWAAAFGEGARVAQALSEPRAKADEAAAGAYVIQDRATLGMLFYRALELLGGDNSSLSRARGLLERVAEAYRTTGNLDILPVSLGFWSEAERRLGDAEHAKTLASEAAALLDQGAPSLLNEAPVYLSLHDACVDTGDLSGAKSAIERGIGHLLRRLRGLEQTPYAHAFLSELSHNAGLIRAAEAYGMVPAEVERVIGKQR